MLMPMQPISGTPGTIVFPFLGADLGGSHISAFTLGNELKTRFAKRCVVIAPEGSAIAREAVDCGFEIVASGERPAMRNNPAYDLMRIPTRIGALNRIGGNCLLHCNDIGALQAYGPAAKVLRIPVVYHHRALNRMILPNRIVLRFADAVICISDHVRCSLQGQFETKVSTILNPFAITLSFDRKAARQSLIERHGLTPDCFLVAFVGNFWRRKRPFFFLDVAKRMLAAHPKARFIVFGRDGEITSRELADRARELGISEHTILAGFQLPIERNIAGVDLLLAPAIEEPFGRTIIEALLLGTPYVATGDAGHAEIAGRWRGGILVAPEADAEFFAQSALAAAAQASAIVLPLERREAVAEELSARGHTNNVLQVYENLVAQR